MERRVVITGLGVVSPNAIGTAHFKNALMEGRSGIRFFKHLEALGFNCCFGGFPELDEATINEFTSRFNLVKLKSSGILYGCMAGVEAWADAGLVYAGDEPYWDSGCVFGTVCSGIEAIDNGIREIDAGTVKKLGGRTAQQAMNSGVSAYVSGILGLGNQVTTNASDYNTGTEALMMAYDRIRSGYAERMLAGSAESNDPYVWAIMDKIDPLNRTGDRNPEKALAPMSRVAKGAVPGAGAGALVLESLDAALNRKARIYAEVLGGHLNSGMPTIDDSVIRSSEEGIAACIRDAMAASAVTPDQVDLISAHLGSNLDDVTEVRAWARALNRKGADFPYINATKSMIGSCLSAAGSMETVASVLQLYHGFVHPTLNATDLRPEIKKIIGEGSVAATMKKDSNIKIAAKLSTGCGGTSACVILKKWTEA